MTTVKKYITYGVAVLLLCDLLVVFSAAFSGLRVPETVSKPFSEALWNNWGFAIVIVALIIFASGAGILVLLGGKWRWE